MEAYENEDLEIKVLGDGNIANNKIYDYVEKSKSWISAMLGVIILIFGITLVFLLASLEGTKEVKASNRDSGKMLTIWREQIGDIGGILFPKEKVDIIQYKDKEYYFVIDEIDDETKEILKWHFAYDGGFEYVFNDFKYYVLTSLVLAVSMFVAIINYRSTIKTEKNKISFKKTLEYYQKRKKKIENITQYIPDFCIYKNKQAYEGKKREIIEDADIDYDFYLNDNFDKSKLEKWQLKKLKKIRRIKIKKIHSSDLLQEHGRIRTKIELLPMSEEEHLRKFIINGFFQKLLSAALGGVVIGFGIEFGNWQLGLTYGFMVVSSWIGSIMVAGEFVNTTLRNRFITKGDNLGEFYNIQDMFIKKSYLPFPKMDKTINAHQENDNLPTEAIESEVLEENGNNNKEIPI